MVKISELSNWAWIWWTEQVPVNDSWTTVKYTVDQMLARQHNHTASQVTDFNTAVDARIDVLTDTAKTTPVDTDVFALWDTVRKKVTRANIKATLKTYFDTLYHTKNALRTGLTASKALVTDWSGNEWYADLPSVVKLAWENITAGNALRLWLWNYSGDTLTQNSTNSNQVYIWYSTTDYAGWQSMTLSNWWTLTSIKIRLRKVWSPSWLLKVSVYDNSWPTLLFWSSNSINETTLTWSDAEYTFNFNNFLPAWTYRFFVRADRAVSTTNYTIAPLHWTITLWTRYVVSSAIAWTPTWWSHRFTVTVSSMNEPTTELFKAKSILRYNNFIWFAKNTATTWNSVYIDQQYNNSQSWLTTNTTYYLSDTAGAISASAWTISKVVWRSISTTELLINLFW